MNFYSHYIKMILHYIFIIDLKSLKKNHIHSRSINNFLIIPLYLIIKKKLKHLFYLKIILKNMIENIWKPKGRPLMLWIDRVQSLWILPWPGSPLLATFWISKDFHYFFLFALEKILQDLWSTWSLYLENSWCHGNSSHCREWRSTAQSSKFNHLICSASLWC